MIKLLIGFIIALILIKNFPKEADYINQAIIDGLSWIVEKLK